MKVLVKAIQTPRISEQINRYKKFLEKPILFNHVVKLQDQIYYNVQYWRWGKDVSVGYLILRPEGEVVPRKEALPVVSLFMLHNLSVQKFTTSYARDKEKPVWMYEQKRDLLQTLLPHVKNNMNNEMQQDAIKLLDVCNAMVESQKQLRDIYDQGMKSHNEMLARGYVVWDDELILRNLLFESDYILYDRLRIQVAIRHSVDRLTDFLTGLRVNHDNDLEKKRKELVRHLNDYRRNVVWKTAEKSIQGFEAYTSGVPVPFHSADHLKEVYQKQNEILLEKDLFPLLRNP